MGKSIATNSSQVTVPVLASLTKKAFGHYAVLKLFSLKSPRRYEPFPRVGIFKKGLCMICDCSWMLMIDLKLLNKVTKMSETIMKLKKKRKKIEKKGKNRLIGTKST